MRLLNRICSMIEEYGDPGIASKDSPVPRWLLWTYRLLPLFGLILLILYWNGSWGWLDPGHWKELQKAANTTFPEIERAEDQFKIQPYE